MSFLRDKPLSFETGKFKKKTVFLPDDQYALALDCLVKGCCDICIFQKSNDISDVAEIDTEVLLGKRKVHPQPDWWYACGGRMKTGEQPWQSAQRIFKRELDLALSDEDAQEKFSLIGFYCYQWEMRQQAPQDNGTADISCVISATLEADEIRKMKADNDEYSDHKWVKICDVLSDNDGIQYHPALKRSLQDYLARREMKKLEQIAKYHSEISDAELGKRFRRLLESIDN